MDGTDLKVVALYMSEEPMPETADQRLKIAGKLIDGPSAKGVALANICVDLLVQPISTRSDFGVDFLEAVEGAMAVAKGLDGRIINPLGPADDGQPDCRRDPCGPRQFLYENTSRPTGPRRWRCDMPMTNASTGTPPGGHR